MGQTFNKIGIVELYLKFRQLGFSIQRLWTNFVVVNYHR